MFASSFNSKHKRDKFLMVVFICHLGPKVKNRAALLNNIIIHTNIHLHIYIQIRDLATIFYIMSSATFVRNSPSAIMTSWILFFFLIGYITSSTTPSSMCNNSEIRRYYSPCSYASFSVTPFDRVLVWSRVLNLIWTVWRPHSFTSLFIVLSVIYLVEQLV